MLNVYKIVLLQNALAQCEVDFHSSRDASASDAEQQQLQQQQQSGMAEATEDPFVARLRTDAAVAQLLDEVRLVLQSKGCDSL